MPDAATGTGVSGDPLAGYGIESRNRRKLMSKRFMLRACAASALLTVSPAALGQSNTVGTTGDPALNVTTTDPLATNTTTTTTTDPLATNTMTADPLANDPMATGAATDPLATDPMMMNTAKEEEEADGFPWGLLGLLGLAGLLGLKKRDDDDREVHVDARRDSRT
jgi:hypothetical protein